MMKTALATLMILLSAATAGANNCAELAQSKAAEMGAQVLAARSEGGVCVVTLRIPGQGGQPPRVDTITIGG